MKNTFTTIDIREITTAIQAKSFTAWLKSNMVSVGSIMVRSNKVMKYDIITVRDKLRLLVIDRGISDKRHKTFDGFLGLVVGMMEEETK